MRRLIAPVLFLALLAAAGCGGTDSEASNDPTTASSPKAASTPRRASHQAAMETAAAWFSTRFPRAPSRRRRSPSWSVSP